MPGVKDKLMPGRGLQRDRPTTESDVKNQSLLRAQLSNMELMHS